MELNRQTIETIANETVPHNFAEWVDTGGGVHNLILHTLTTGEVDDHSRADGCSCTAGPLIAIGPFCPDGSAEAPEIAVWNETKRVAEDWDDEGDAVWCADTDAIKAAFAQVLAWSKA